MSSPAFQPWFALQTLCAAALLSLSLGGLSRGQAQTLTQGALSGVLRKATGESVSGALVTLRDRASGSTRNLPVSTSAEFDLRFLDPGEYDLTIEAIGSRPLRIERIPVSGGRMTRVDPRLTQASDGAELEVHTYRGSSVGSLQSISSGQLNAFPHHGREVAFATLLTTSATPELESEGLPGSLSALRINGSPVSLAPDLGLHGPAISFPLSAFQQAELANASADVERSGTAAGEFSTRMVRGSSQLGAKLFGSWENGSSVNELLASPSFTAFEGGALISGPLQKEVASFVLGIELWRNKRPIGFPERIDSVLSNVDQRLDADIASAGPQHLSSTKALAGFGRIDWQLNPRHNLALHALVGSQPDDQRRPTAFDGVAALANLEVFDLTAGATLSSQFSANIAQELRVSFDRVKRSDSVDADSIAHTTVLDNLVRAAPITVGPQLLRGSEFESSTLRLGETFHYWSGNHHIKLGLSADVSSYNVAAGVGTESRFWSPNSFYFNSLDSLYTVTTTGRGGVSFKQTQLGLFAQDEWNPVDGLRLLFGVRYDIDAPPVDDVQPNADWFDLSGLGSDSVLERYGRLSPRVEFEWQPDAARRWSLRGWGGLWSAPIDPSLIGQLIWNDGRARAHRGFEPAQEWPSVAVPDTLPTLTMLPAGFRGPRSRRGGLELTSAIASGLVIQVAGNYRRTERLPRVADLNLAALPASHDQYGRPIFGTLVKKASLVAAAANSNRRFREFDQVTAYSADGWSEYRAVSGGLQVNLSSRLFVHGRYTFSKTEDNWFMARAGLTPDAISPFPKDSVSDWREGRSDFDVPHRLWIGAELTNPLLAGIHLGVNYRYRSGYPFTPGFLDGVDANGDGSLSNDPAFIDDALGDFSLVRANNSCLAGQVGKFAERNSCREPAMSALDARIAVGFAAGGQRRAELVVDALNLFQSGGEEVDRALLQLDNAALVTDAGTNATTVPLIMNLEFGTPLLRVAGATVLRVGLRVTF
jgi:hypothetical protein